MKPQTPNRSHRRPRATIRHLPLAILTGMVLAAAVPGTTSAQANPDTLNRLMKASTSTKQVRLSPVREAALRASARTLGAQTGLIERAQEITTEVNKRRQEMERAFRFGDLVIGSGVLPPVLVATQNAAAVKDDTMRLAGAVYRIKQPARFFTGAPSWRDWLLLGLPSPDDAPEMPRDEQLLPRDSQERAYWEQEVKAAYFSGRAQAQEIFDHNLAMLEETYLGMRTFYDLHQRNMVSAPVIAQAQEIVTHDDPNTIVVGDTLFRITMPSQFETDPEKWKALRARPSVEKPLPVVPGFDPAQVREAYEVYKLQQARRQAELEAKKRGVKDPEAQMAQVVPAAPPAPSMPVTQTQPVSAPQVIEERYVIKLPDAPVSAPSAPAPALPTVPAISRPLFTVPSK